MTRPLLRRLVQGASTLVGITLLTFSLAKLSPGDPVSLMLAGSGEVAASDLAALREAYGVGEPLPSQYVRWLARAAHGDFGQSLLHKRPVLQLIGSALPNTLLLSGLALAMSVAVGVPLGALAALRRGSLADQAVRLLCVTGHAVPQFWLGLAIIATLSVHLRLLPVGGTSTIGASAWDVSDRLAHLIGPLLTLSLPGIATYARLMRAEVLELLGKEFVQAASAKGLGWRTVMFRHVLRNALMPVVTALGGTLATLVSGSLVVEHVFAWPGMGRLAFEAARTKDYPVVMGVVVLVSAVILSGYIIRDMAYGVVDPRVDRA